MAQNILGVEAPVVFPDKGELGDKRLDPKENVAKLKEKIRQQRAKDIVAEQKYLTMDASLGRPLGWREFIRKLKLLVPSLLVMDGGYPNAIQLRVHNPHHAPDEPDTRYVGGFMKDILTEWDVATVDKWGVANAPRRGWHTVVKNLIKEGIATKRDADKIFGEATGERSALWFKQLQAKELNK